MHMDPRPPLTYRAQLKDGTYVSTQARSIGEAARRLAGRYPLLQSNGAGVLRAWAYRPAMRDQRHPRQDVTPWLRQELQAVPKRDTTDYAQCVAAAGQAYQQSAGPCILPPLHHRAVQLTAKVIEEDKKQLDLAQTQATARTRALTAELEARLVKARDAGASAHELRGMCDDYWWAGTQADIQQVEKEIQGYQAQRMRDWPSLGMTKGQQEAELAAVGVSKMNRGELIGWIKDRAVEYRKVATNSVARNHHMNALGGHCRLTQDEVDALLTDFVNYCGVRQGVDYAMYTEDFAKDAGDSVR